LLREGLGRSKESWGNENQWANSLDRTQSQDTKKKNQSTDGGPKKNSQKRGSRAKFRGGSENLAQKNVWPKSQRRDKIRRTTHAGKERRRVGP